MKHMDRFKSLVGKANKIVISTHIFPDADGIGSQIALCLALKSIGKETICVNEEELMDRYDYLDPQKTIISAETYLKENSDPQIDLFIVVDTNSPMRIGGSVQKLLSKSRHVLFIDHHPCPVAIEAIHCIDTSAAATGQLVGALIEGLGIEFTKEMALPLYTAILIDTSSFRYPTVTAETHRILSKLMETGLHPPKAYNNIYGTKKVSHMQLLGTILKESQTTEDGSVGWIVVRDKDIKKYDSDPEDTLAFINHLLVLDGIKVAMMFRDIDSKYVKISFRSNGVIDVGIIAQAFGGGGHNHSAATIVEGNLDEVIQDVTTKIKLMV